MTTLIGMLFSQLRTMWVLAGVLTDRLRTNFRDDRGMTTETIIITAILAALAIGAVTVIATKVGNKAETIQVE